MDALDVSRKAPGCFGAASVFSSDAALCQACMAFKHCQVESLRTLKAIREQVDVEALLRRHAQAIIKARQEAADADAEKPTMAFAASAAGMAALERVKPEPKSKPKPAPKAQEVAITGACCRELDTLNVKPRDLAEKLLRRGLIDAMRKDLAQGRNPMLNEKPVFVSVICAGLLRGALTRSEIRDLFKSELGWSTSSASSHVNIVVPVLLAFGLVEEKNGRVILVPRADA
jgi:hypothetical protein